MKVEIDLPDEQCKFIEYLIRINPFFGPFEDFIRDAIRRHQERAIEIIAMGRMKATIHKEIGNNSMP